MPSRLWLSLALLLAVCLPTAAQNSQPEMTSEDSPATFKSKVNLVLVPVIVRDAQGHAIGTLRKEDFQLFDKGKAQVISRFSVEKAGASKSVPISSSDTVPGEESAGPATSTIVIPTRFVAYVFDDLNVSASDLMRVQKAATHHLATALLPTDRAAIFTTSGRGNLDFTGDANKLHDAVMRLRPQPLFSEGPNPCPDLTYYMADLIINKNDQQTFNVAVQDTLACAGMTQQEITSAQQMVQSSSQRLVSIGEHATRMALISLSDIVRRMTTVPGQRTIVLVSPGFLTITPDSLESVTNILDRAARANVMISALDARGLYTDSEFDASNRGSSTPQMQIAKSQLSRTSDLIQADVMAELADGSGGTFVHNSNDLDGGLSRLAAAPEYMYLLGFSPGNMKADGTYHHLKIQLQDGKGLTFQARRGYYAPKQAASEEDSAKEEIRDAVYSREELHDLPVDLHTQFFKPDPADAKLTVVARVDLKRLHFKKQEGRNNDNLTVVSVLFDRDGNLLTAIQKTITMRLRDETLQRLSSGITVKTNFDVKPGAYLVRLVVRDAQGNLMSAANGAVDIP